MIAAAPVLVAGIPTALCMVDVVLMAVECWLTIAEAAAAEGNPSPVSAAAAYSYDLETGVN